MAFAPWGGLLEALIVPQWTMPAAWYPAELLASLQMAVWMTQWQEQWSQLR